MKIEHAIDFQDVSIAISREMNSIGYNPDLKKMYANIQKMVTELSKLEVHARRSPRSTITVDKVAQINQAIDHLNKLILIAKLMS
jgi:hypothetical protein